MYTRINLPCSDLTSAEKGCRRNSHHGESRFGIAKRRHVPTSRAVPAILGPKSPMRRRAGRFAMRLLPEQPPT